MTGYTVHTGSSERFTEGWDQIFGRGKKPASKKKKTAKSVAGKVGPTKTKKAKKAKKTKPKK